MRDVIVPAIVQSFPDVRLVAMREGLIESIFYLQDERLTSKAAAENFAHMRAAGVTRRKDARNSDSLAAQVMLEDWLSEPGEPVLP